MLILQYKKYRGRYRSQCQALTEVMNTLNQRLGREERSWQKKDDGKHQRIGMFLSALYLL